MNQRRASQAEAENSRATPGPTPMPAPLTTTHTRPMRSNPVTTFEARDFHRLTIHDMAGTNAFIVQFEDTAGEFTAGHVFQPEQAPAIALAILEAAGVEVGDFDRPWSVGEPSQLEHVAHELSRHVAMTKRATEAAAEQTKLSARRNELAMELREPGTGVIDYRHCTRPLKRAIDRIIDLEASK